MWYGEVEKVNPTEIKKLIFDESINEEELIFNLVDLFKLGDFSLKPLLVQLMNSTGDDEVLQLCIEIFSSIATHEDIRDSDNFIFLLNASTDTLKTFTARASDFLSYEIVPYLLVLLEEWTGNYQVEAMIRDALAEILGAVLGDDVTFEDIGNYYLGIENSRSTSYFYEQKPSFAGDLTKIIQQRAMSAMYLNEPFKMYTIPSLLSIWSGKKCPLEYETIVTNQVVKEILDYTESLSKMEWERGKKYFYGHIV
ncbi:MAG: Imm47 family immunity protein [Defluviitaleaceae bacterium]|nr:Imm47 family immunity protein [Defluviitaleaceae bacterium]